ncbi:MAG TPA: hypothetical protein VFT34_06635 [Verrucomicrobiae bacterium]|nr:hypothetical protein [Verrucomicrobiae bacterium]
MKPNPILEELWKIKDDLAREAGYDTHRFFENLRKWAAEHPHSGPVVHSAEELRQLVAERERRRAEESAMALNDKPPRKP